MLHFIFCACRLHYPCTKFTLDSDGSCICNIMWTSMQKKSNFCKKLQCERSIWHDNSICNKSKYTVLHLLFCFSSHFQIPGVKYSFSPIPCIWRALVSRSQAAPMWAVWFPPLLSKQRPSSGPVFTFPFECFPPWRSIQFSLTRGHERAGWNQSGPVNGRGQTDMWRFVRWAPNLSTADYHSLMSTPVCVCLSAASPQNVLSPLQLCARPERSVDYRCPVNRETHTWVIKAAGGLVLYQPCPILLVFQDPPSRL